MGKYTNIVLAAMLASPFIVRFFRKRRLLRFWKPIFALPDLETDIEVQEHFIRIPAFAVASVIGKRGQTLRKMMYDTQTECVIRSYTPEELDVAEYFTTDGEWLQNFESNDWFAEEETTGRKITYLMVRTSDERRLEMVRLRILEIIETVQLPWKSSEFLVDTHMVGYLVGRGGRNINNLRDKFNVQIQISDPNPENPEKCTVMIRGRDLTSMKEVEIVMKETVLPKNYNRVHRYDEDTLIENGIYEDVNQELEDLKKAGERLAEGFI